MTNTKPLVSKKNASKSNIEGVFKVKTKKRAKRRLELYKWVGFKTRKEFLEWCQNLDNKWKSGKGWEISISLME